MSERLKDELADVEGKLANANALLRKLQSAKEETANTKVVIPSFVWSEKERY